MIMMANQSKMSVLKQKKDRIGAKLLAILAALTLPLEEYYVFGTQVNLNYVVLLLPLLFVTKKTLRNLGLRKSFLQMGAFYILLSIMVFLFWGNEVWFGRSVFNNIVFAIPVTFIILYFYTDSFNIQTFLKCVTLFAALASLVVIYQRFSFLLTGDYYSGFTLENVPGLTFVRDDSLERQVRPSGFFSEPSHFATFCLPVFAFSILSRKYTLALLLFFGIIVSGSTNGLVGIIVVIISALMLDHTKNGSKKKRFFAGLGFVGLIGIGYAIMDYYFPEIMGAQFGKLDNTDAGESARLLGPLPILANFDWEWLFGIGIGNKNDYIKAFHIKVAGGTDDTMTNTIFSLLIYFGIVGFIVFAVFLIRLYIKCCKGSNISYFVLMITLFFSSNFIFAGNLLYYLFFVANTKYIAKESIIFQIKKQ